MTPSQLPARCGGCEVGPLFLSRERKKMRDAVLSEFERLVLSDLLLKYETNGEVVRCSSRWL